MATSATDDIATAVGRLVTFVFRLSFPMVILVTCAASITLSGVFHVYQFSGWGLLLAAVLKYSATNNLWLGLTLVVVAIAAFPLAWIAYREHSAQTSSVIGRWGMALLITAVMTWVASAWPWDGSGLQLFVGGVLLLEACNAYVDALVSAFKFRAQARANRPPPAPIHQQPHGTRDEPETI